jgi:leucyl aminopeptidase
MPLHRRYRRYVDSTFADLKNSSAFREAGAVLAAEFLREFAGDGPFVHVDIAGTSTISRSRGDYLWQPGATGYGVRLLVELATRLAA